jgi:histidine triad (HIT) family protein
MAEETCIFCDIAEGRRAAEVIYQDEILVAFHDIHPAAPVHILVVPRKHIRSINDLTEEDRETVSEMIFRSREIAKMAEVDGSGFKLVFNTETGAGQVIFHLHMHLLGGWADGWARR